LTDQRNHETGATVADAALATRSVGYEVFIAAITLLSLVNTAIWIIERDSPWAAVAFIMDYALSLILVLDFLIRLWSAPVKRRYVVNKWGWADLLGSLPFPAFRILRLFRFLLVLRRLHKLGFSTLRKYAVRQLSESALLLVTLLMVLLVEFGSILVLRVEAGVPGGNIETGEEAIWWSVVTIATVGYGDYTPVTAIGRTVGVATMFLGITLISILTGYIANTFFSRRTSAGNDGEGLRGEFQPEFDRINAALLQIQASLDQQRSPSVNQEQVQGEERHRDETA
jgi:voltage-gated potassium channel